MRTGKMKLIIIAAVGALALGITAMRRPLADMKDLPRQSVVQVGSNSLEFDDDEKVEELCGILSEYKGWRIGESAADFLLGQSGGSWTDSISIYTGKFFIEINPNGSIWDGEKYIYLSLTDTAERGKELYERLEEWLKEAGINENGGDFTLRFNTCRC